MNNHLHFRAAFPIILFCFSLANSAGINSVQTIIDDMTLPPDARPHGVPDNYDWSSGAATQPGQFGSSAGMYAATTWGQLYVPREGNPASNTRVQIRNEAMYALSNADGKWHQVQYSESVQGAAFVEDFANNASKASDARTEATGGISVTAGGGYNFHFWPYGARASIDPNNLKALYATVQARLIVDDPGKSRSISCNLAAITGKTRMWAGRPIGTTITGSAPADSSGSPRPGNALICSRWSRSLISGRTRPRLIVTVSRRQLCLLILAAFPAATEERGSPHLTT